MDTIQDKIDDIIVIKDNIISNIKDLEYEFSVSKRNKLIEKLRTLWGEVDKNDTLNLTHVGDSNLVNIKVKCIGCSVSDLCPNKYNELSYCLNRTEKKNIRRIKRISELSLSIILTVTHKSKECKVNVDSINKTLCCRCWVNKASSAHHIIPRKYGGQDYKNNFIGLCDKCHDYVEIKTEDLIESGSHYDVDLLRFLIMSDGFK